ncbi:MAG: hypothetical protein IPN32_38970 [Deltaproteobacteria bacterium]|nr:hypothetical protein [Deltaproteobacteria bacterium]
MKRDTGKRKKPSGASSSSSSKPSTASETPPESGRKEKIKVGGDDPLDGL